MINKTLYTTMAMNANSRGTQTIPDILTNDERTGLFSASAPRISLNARRIIRVTTATIPLTKIWEPVTIVVVVVVVTVVIISTPYYIIKYLVFFI